LPPPGGGALGRGRPADVDEAIFVAGPILVTALATGVHPAAGVGTAAALGLAGTRRIGARPEA
jgi:hypothetical protein